MWKYKGKEYIPVCNCGNSSTWRAGDYQLCSDEPGVEILNGESPEDQVCDECHFYMWIEVDDE